MEYLKKRNNKEMKRKRMHKSSKEYPKTFQHRPDSCIDHVKNSWSKFPVVGSHTIPGTIY